MEEVKMILKAYLPS